MKCRLLLLLLLLFGANDAISYYKDMKEFKVHEVRNDDVIEAHSADVVLRASTEPRCNPSDKIGLQIDQGEIIDFYCHSYYFLKHQEASYDIQISEKKPFAPFKLKAVPFPLDDEADERIVGNYLPMWLKATCTGFIVALTMLLSIPTIFEHMQGIRSETKKDYVPEVTFGMPSMEDPTSAIDLSTREAKKKNKKKNKRNNSTMSTVQKIRDKLSSIASRSSATMTTSERRTSSVVKTSTDGGNNGGSKSKSLTVEGVNDMETRTATERSYRTRRTTNNSQDYTVTASEEAPNIGGPTTPVEI